MISLVRRVYSPSRYGCSIDVDVTEEQALALDRIWKRDEFSAFFWAEKVGWLNNGCKTSDGDRTAIINGEHYAIETEEPTAMRGMGGRKSKIRYKTGEVVQTTNLWYQGEVPEELRGILKDTADWED